MSALTTSELASVVLALVAFVLIGFYRVLTDNMNLRERVARLEEAVKILLGMKNDRDS